MRTVNRVLIISSKLSVEFLNTLDFLKKTFNKNGKGVKPKWKATWFGEKSVFRMLI